MTDWGNPEARMRGAARENGKPPLCSSVPLMS